MINTIYSLKRQMLLFVFSLFFGVSYLAAQTVVSGNTVLKVNSGTTYSDLSSGVTVNSNGAITNDGTIYLKGNLTNNGSASLGTGTFVMNGTSSQTISGNNTFNNLTVNNTAGVILSSGTARVENTLTLTAGRIDIGNNNLILGSSAAAVAGTLNASNMIVATGTGEVRKEFSGSGAASYTYPVGDNTSTAEYSPVTLSFTSGTYAAGSYAGVNLKNLAYPGVGTDAYLNRYWNLSQSGITSFSCDATFNYVPADVIAPESSIYTVKVAPDPIVTYDAANTTTHYLHATGLNSFSTFTGMRAALTASFTAMLEGPYSGGAMTTNLNSANLIPLSQPFNAAPWNYTGTESVGSIPAGVVDWVLVELRQASSPANANLASRVSRKAAFIKSDGTIVAIDGTSPLRFDNSPITSNVYPLVWHRNHMPVMANNASTKNTSGVYVYNFASGDGSQIYGTGKKQLATTTWGLMAGDGDQDVQIQNSDFVIWATTAGESGVYFIGDYDMDGQLQNSDFVKWASNAGESGNIPQ